MRRSNASVSAWIVFGCLWIVAARATIHRTTFPETVNPADTRLIPVRRRGDTAAEDNCGGKERNHEGQSKPAARASAAIAALGPRSNDERARHRAAQGTIMTRSRAVRGAPAMLAALALLLGAWQRRRAVGQHLAIDADPDDSDVCDAITQRVANRHDRLDCVRVEAVRLQPQAPTRVARCGPLNATGHSRPTPDRTRTRAARRRS